MINAIVVLFLILSAPVSALTFSKPQQTHIEPIDITQLPTPYNELKNLLAPKLDGWLAEPNRRELTKMLRTLKPHIIVEVGSWLGLSAITMALLLQDNGRLYAVDHWQGSVEHQDSLLLPTLYEQFLSNVIHHRLTEKIIPIRMASTDAAKSFTLKADLIYIDAAHTEDAVYNDIMAWYPQLTPHGIICGDDYYWGSNDAVKRGVDRAAAELGCTVEVYGNIFWKLKRP